MSYVSVDAPLPQNSMSPVSACQINRAQQVRDSVEASVAKAKAASSMIASPASFAEFGPGVVRDAARGQNELIAGNSLTVQPHRNGAFKALRNAPRQVPLNVTEQEYSGCKTRNIGALQPVPMPPNAQKIVMPAPAPTDTNLITAGNTLPVSRGGMALPAPRPMQYMSIVPTVQNRGLRGLGIAWGDAIADQPGNSDSGISGKGILLLALAGLGLYAATRTGKR